MRTICAALLLISYLGEPSIAAEDTTGGRARMLVLADMGNEPDEEQQIVHLVACCNEFDVEGLIAVTGKYLHPGSPTAYRQRLHPELFHQIIDAYEKAFPNLKKHADGWADPDHLRSVVASGQTGYGIEDTGPGKSTAGSKRIIDAVTKDDPRPLWVVVNAGSNTLAQALIDYRASHTAAEVADFVSRLRVFENGAQDNSGAWICAEFPDIHWIRSNYQTYAYGGPGGDGKKDNRGSRQSLGPYTWKPYEYSGLGQHHWALDHIKSDNGPLGVAWPLRQFSGGRLSFLEGGGTVPWLGLVNKGLFSIDHVNWGGWSGRFDPQKTSNDWSKHRSVRDDEQTGRPFKVYAEAEDHWIDPETGEDFSGIFAPVWRFRRATWNDFAARLDWCVRSYDQANHHPVAAIGDDAGDAILFRSGTAGEPLSLDATKSTDPDGDQLRFRWWFYPEAGTYTGELPAIRNGETATPSFNVPQDANGQTIHLVLEITDTGRPYPLTDYRRIVIRVGT
ncbi:nucleoside hydrolase-like domain-containing protein [Crateriforma conspicua]|uniref:Secreted protein containing DUF1593 n=1 Tax=Crateriforma conspicua TaxID=2527996 RepID=A0A5C5Y299_9PLAN|nr:nucleoside hydrolase-like domain-containing protein [Crateriforma conspicua]TWT68365.1 hypothetical protein Pan14r_06090 [Crateriforma conspicua]